MGDIFFWMLIIFSVVVAIGAMIRKRKADAISGLIASAITIIIHILTIVAIQLEVEEKYGIDCSFGDAFNGYVQTPLGLGYLLATAFTLLWNLVLVFVIRGHKADRDDVASALQQGYNSTAKMNAAPMQGMNAAPMQGTYTAQGGNYGKPQGAAPQMQPAGAKFCMQCGMQLSADATFCMGCGNKLQ